MTEKTMAELRAETDQLMHRPLHMDHEARIAALAAERNAADFEIERLTRERDEARAEVEELRTRTAAQLEIETRARDAARADAARLRRALEEATEALAVDPRFLSPARLGTARSILAAALAGEGEGASDA